MTELRTCKNAPDTTFQQAIEFLAKHLIDELKSEINKFDEYSHQCKHLYRHDALIQFTLFNTNLYPSYISVGCGRESMIKGLNQNCVFTDTSTRTKCFHVVSVIGHIIIGPKYTELFKNNFNCKFSYEQSTQGKTGTLYAMWTNPLYDETIVTSDLQSDIRLPNFLAREIIKAHCTTNHHNSPYGKIIFNALMCTHIAMNVDLCAFSEGKKDQYESYRTLEIFYTSSLRKKIFSECALLGIELFEHNGIVYTPEQEQTIDNDEIENFELKL